MKIRGLSKSKIELYNWFEKLQTHEKSFLKVPFLVKLNSNRWVKSMRYF